MMATKVFGCRSPSLCLWILGRPACYEPMPASSKPLRRLRGTIELVAAPRKIDDIMTRQCASIAFHQRMTWLFGGARKPALGIGTRKEVDHGCRRISSLNETGEPWADQGNCDPRIRSGRGAAPIRATNGITGPNQGKSPQPIRSMFNDRKC